MGLFDKLRSVFSTGDSPVKRYYEVILDLLTNVEYLTKENVKTYFQGKYNEECDDVALEKALTKFRTWGFKNDDKTWYCLTSAQREKQGFTISNIKRDEILGICFSDFINEARINFNKVLKIVEEKPSLSFFEQGFRKTINSTPLEPSFMGQLVGKTFAEEMFKGIISNNSTIRAILVDLVHVRLSEKYKEKGYHGLTSYSYAISLRALHFEKYINNLNEYKPFANEACSAAVLNTKYYQEEIDTYVEKNPFDAKPDVFVEHRAKEIYEAQFFCRSAFQTSSDWEHYAAQNMQFTDAICYYAWKNIAKFYPDVDATELESIVNAIVNHTIDEGNK